MAAAWQRKVPTDARKVALLVTRRSMRQAFDRVGQYYLWCTSGRRLSLRYIGHPSGAASGSLPPPSKSEPARTPHSVATILLKPPQLGVRLVAGTLHGLGRAAVEEAVAPDESFRRPETTPIPSPLLSDPNPRAGCLSGSHEHLFRHSIMYSTRASARGGAPTRRPGSQQHFG